MRTPYDTITTLDGAAARDRYVARARSFVEESLPADLKAVPLPVFFVPSPEDLASEPHDLGNGWWGYEGGAAYNRALDWTAARETGERKQWQ